MGLDTENSSVRNPGAFFPVCPSAFPLCLSGLLRPVLQRDQQEVRYILRKQAAMDTGIPSSQFLLINQNRVTDGVRCPPWSDDKHEPWELTTRTLCI